MFAAAFVLGDIVDGFAPEFLVSFVDSHFATIEAGAPASEFVLSLDFGISELLGLTLGMFFGGSVEAPFLVVDADAIIEVELILPRAEVLNDALEPLEERQHF